MGYVDYPGIEDPYELVDSVLGGFEPCLCGNEHPAIVDSDYGGTGIYCMNCARGTRPQRARKVEGKWEPAELRAARLWNEGMRQARAKMAKDPNWTDGNPLISR